VDPALFFNLQLGVWVLVHVDDMFLAGRRGDVELLFQPLQAAMKLRETGRLYGVGDCCNFLNKRIYRTASGFALIGNLWLVDELVKKHHLENTKYVATPAVQYTTRQILDSAELCEEERRAYRTDVGVLMHIAHDRCDIQWATKEVARSMQHPTEIDAWRVKRICRYLAHHRELYQMYEVTEEVTRVVTTVDADWGGCVKSRRSSCGGVMCLQQATLLTWARTQGGVALSSMESEYRGLAVGAQESLLVKHLLGELGYEVEVTLRRDSTSAAAAAQRRGVLHVKHRALRLLFIKELVERGLISLERVSSEANTADWLTKPLGQ
jgi:hypothetical protein